jgi:large subunit ribosomal protein L10
VSFLVLKGIFMPNQINKDIVSSLKDKVSKAKSVTFTDYIGLSANNVNELRRQLEENGSEMVVAKNTLFRNALKEQGVKDADKLDEHLKGPTAAIFSYNDSVAPLKTIYTFIKNFELPKVKVGIFDGALTTAEQVEVISKLPSKDVLVAQLLGVLKSPLNGTVQVFSGVQRKFVYAVKAIADKKGGAQ